jgi:outer membrane protein OmpA-like peptidoglycan-associated protein
LLSVSLSFNSFAQNIFGWSDKTYHEGDKRIIRTIHWDLDKAGLERDTATILTFDTIIEFLTTHPLLKVEIGNHTDPQGSGTHNNHLSLARAWSIVDYIRHYSHIDSARLIAKGYGSTQPIYDTNYIKKLKTATERQAAYQIDRRTEIKILSTCCGHEAFNWNDSVFYVGSKRIIHTISYTTDKPGIYLDSATRKTLDTISLFLTKHPHLKAEIGVYRDPQGSAKLEKHLSQALAQSVVDYLRYHGQIDSARMTPVGYGFSLPIIDMEQIKKMKTMEEREAAFQIDRRTEIKIIEN